MRTLATAATALAAAAALSGCYFDEGLPIDNLKGTVILPEEAAQRTILTPDGEQDLDDVRLIGPVILGLYSGVSQTNFDYPHPLMGPAFEPGLPGDTLPYGGTTIGDIRFACVEKLACKLSSGRHVDFQSIIDWFELLGDPVVDAFDRPITSGAYLREICYDILEVTSEAEVRITATSDRNEDGVIDEGDLDFVRRNDGKWEAEFTLWQQEFFQDIETGQGMTLWGWHDAPKNEEYTFSTCNPEDGYSTVEYNVSFDAGRFERELLNFPSSYIETGDWVSSTGYQYNSIDDIAEIEIDYRVER